jgi:hypothetical protein
MVQPQKEELFLQSWYYILKHGRDNTSIPQLKELEHKEAAVSAETREKKEVDKQDQPQQ